MDNRRLLSKGKSIIVIFIVCFACGYSSPTVYAADPIYKSNGQVDFYGTYKTENGENYSKDQHNQSVQEEEKAHPSNQVLPRAGDTTESTYLIFGWILIFISLVFLMIFKVSKQKRRNEHEIFEN
ncbi:hypothetical protein RGT17_02805 [Bacillus altitudinis]|uniref:hypothetical protein n=1 Tax=Bacillus pumilus TaxID=1408 RepID=UPI0025A101CD|nr:hypothetical protein [Bacillus pumilus]MDM5319189.1 hypothetical protein [Bacillus pumilus]MDR4994169.1 hypothetical protein [Bacillus altitudinis]